MIVKLEHVQVDAAELRRQQALIYGFEYFVLQTDVGLVDFFGHNGSRVIAARLAVAYAHLGVIAGVNACLGLFHEATNFPVYQPQVSSIYALNNNIIW